MNVRVLAFARVRELLGVAQRGLELADGARVGDAWTALERDCPALGEIAASTRLARNGRIAEAGDSLCDGDELALLPPVGGG